jgi:enoyl-CoA hydratase/carnithine racemase
LENVMSTPDYFTRFTNLAMDRTDDGVLVVRFHTDGGPITFTGQTHQDLPRALEEIALDRENKALVLTGTGDSFMDSIDGGASARSSSPRTGRRSAPRAPRSCSAS